MKHAIWNHGEVGFGASIAWAVLSATGIRNLHFARHPHRCGKLPQRFNATDEFSSQLPFREVLLGNLSSVSNTASPAGSHKRSCHQREIANYRAVPRSICCARHRLHKKPDGPSKSSQARLTIRQSKPGRSSPAPMKPAVIDLVSKRALPDCGRAPAGRSRLVASGHAPDHLQSCTNSDLATCRWEAATCAAVFS